MLMIPNLFDKGNPKRMPLK